MFSAVLSAWRRYLVFTCLSQDRLQSAAIHAVSRVCLQGAGILMFYDNIVCKFCMVLRLN